MASLLKVIKSKQRRLFALSKCGDRLQRKPKCGVRILGLQIYRPSKNKALSAPRGVFPSFSYTSYVKHSTLIRTHLERFSLQILELVKNTCHATVLDVWHDGSRLFKKNTLERLHGLLAPAVNEAAIIPPPLLWMYCLSWSWRKAHGESTDDTCPTCS